VAQSSSTEAPAVTNTENPVDSKDSGASTASVSTIEASDLGAAGQTPPDPSSAQQQVESAASAAATIEASDLGAEGQTLPDPSSAQQQVESAASAAAEKVMDSVSASDVIQGLEEVMPPLQVAPENATVQEVLAPTVMPAPVTPAAPVVPPQPPASPLEAFQPRGLFTKIQEGLKASAKKLTSTASNVMKGLDMLVVPPVHAEEFPGVYVH
jgi:hypothetical protein